jgi:hypothetical protein
MMVSGLTAAGLLSPAGNGSDFLGAADSPKNKPRTPRVADDVLRKLLEGNRRCMSIEVTTT